MKEIKEMLKIYAVMFMSLLAIAAMMGLVWLLIWLAGKVEGISSKPSASLSLYVEGACSIPSYPRPLS